MSLANLSVNFFVALFALIDPIGNVPVFAAATVGAASLEARMGNITSKLAVGVPCLINSYRCLG